MNILQSIVQKKEEEVAFRKRFTSADDLVKKPLFDRKCLSLSSSITSCTNGGIIAEFKRKSPSKPNFRLEANVSTITSAYCRAGAAALSILTDKTFFGGDEVDILTARSLNEIPILRKDFIIDEYQILEAKSIGADAILLIAEVLSKAEIIRFSTLATECGMEVLFELNHVDQIFKYADSIQLIGVNNRNLKDFTTNIQTSLDLLPKLPLDSIKISESGLQDVHNLALLFKKGFQGFLIGESLMKASDPGIALKELKISLKSLLC